jgi:hypothetical protein
MQAAAAGGNRQFLCCAASSDVYSIRKSLKHPIRESAGE